ncbi:GBS Bsp-like repeat-containing protein, partial [Enterococcus camelliae]
SANFKNSGEFYTHVYVTNNGKNQFLGATSYNLAAPPANIITKTVLSNSKIKITIANPNGGNAQMVQFPTWSKTNGQDDIRWLKGTKNGDGSWSVTVDSANFKNSGEFYTHVYVTNNGKNQFLGATSYNLAAPPANIITKMVLSNSKIKITIANPNGGNAQMVQFPTWSKTNGQDDIRWLKGTKNGDGSWSVTVDSANFKNSGEFYTHVYVTNNGKNQFLGATSYSLSMDEVKNRLAHPPFYYSQLDWRWKTKNYGMANLGAAGCVPTSMAMILKGQFGLNVTPIDTANRLYSYGGYNQQYFGASGIDFVRGMNSYGRTIMMIRSLNELNDYLSKGYAVVMFVDVGIGHAIVAHTYANGKTLVYDPYGKQFYSGYASTNSLWNSPSKDRIDWTAGRPYFAVK